MSESTEVELRHRGPRRFPYYTLKTAIEVASKVYLEGGGKVSRVGAAELLGIKSNSSALEMRLITAAQFGLVKRTDGQVEITSLGQRVIRPDSEAEKSRALMESFSSVPLFRDVLNRYKGMPLPAEAGLRNVLIRDFQVPERLKNDALNALMNSAKEAGILVSKPSGVWFSTVFGAPPGGSDDETPTDGGPQDNETRPPTMRANRTTTPLHPSIEGLLGDLPSPGSDWTAEDRDAWEAALKAVFDVAYPSSRRNRNAASAV